MYLASNDYGLHSTLITGGEKAGGSKKGKWKREDNRWSRGGGRHRLTNIVNQRSQEEGKGDKKSKAPTKGEEKRALAKGVEKEVSKNRAGTRDETKRKRQQLTKMFAPL